MAKDDQTWIPEPTDLEWIESILAPHPADERFDKILQRFGEHLRQKTAFVAGLQQAIAVAGYQ